MLEFTGDISDYKEELERNRINAHKQKASEYYIKWLETGLSFYRAWQAHELMQVGRKRKLMIDDDMLDAYLESDPECLPFHRIGISDNEPEVYDRDAELMKTPYGYIR